MARKSFCGPSLLRGASLGAIAVMLSAVLGCESSRPSRAPELINPFDEIPQRDGWIPLWMKLNELQLADGIELAPTGDETAVQISGGIMFGNTVASNSVSVDLTAISVSTDGSSWNMDSIKVFAGSGTPPATFTTALVTVTPPDKKNHIVPAASITGEPTYKLNQGSYWVRVEVAVKENGGSAAATLVGWKEYALLASHPIGSYSTWQQ